MKIFRGLENLNSVIDQHEYEWRREQGEEPEKRETVSLEEAVRRRLTAQPSEGSGRFSADRFLGGNSGPAKNEPEAVEIIKAKDERHSWLYNEVMKAVKDASKGGKTKVIAVFIPVIQNGKEFEELPVDETVTLSPIDEEFTRIEELPEHEPEQESEQVIENVSEDFQLLPEPQAEPDPELAAAFTEMEEKLDEQILEKRQQEEQEEQEQEEAEQEAVTVTEEEPEPKLEAEPATVIEILPEEQTPEAQEEQEGIEEAAEVQEIEENEEIEDSEESEESAEGEPLTFEKAGEAEEVEEPEAEEFSLPEILDDDEVADDDAAFDETLTEIQSAGEDEGEDEEAETIIIDETEDENSEDDEDKEVEIIPEH